MSEGHAIIVGGIISSIKNNNNDDFNSNWIYVGHFEKIKALLPIIINLSGNPHNHAASPRTICGRLSARSGQGSKLRLSILPRDTCTLVVVVAGLELTTLMV